MPQMIFVNLPVRDLPKARAFWQALGFSFNEQFSDDTAACLVFSETIFAMLLTHPKFEGFAPKPITDTDTSVEVLIALNRDSREQVDAMIADALAAGGTTFGEPQDLGFMYGRSFRDLDGHVWEAFWMDPAAVQG